MKPDKYRIVVYIDDTVAYELTQVTRVDLSLQTGRHEPRKFYVEAWRVTPLREQPTVAVEQPFIEGEWNSDQQQEQDADPYGPSGGSLTTRFRALLDNGGASGARSLPPERDPTSDSDGE